MQGDPNLETPFWGGAVRIQGYLLCQTLPRRAIVRGTSQVAVLKSDFQELLEKPGIPLL